MANKIKWSIPQHKALCPMLQGFQINHIVTSPRSHRCLQGFQKPLICPVN
jgi:hypothetical protein